MNRTLKYQLLIATTSAAVFFVNLGGLTLPDMDEALYSECAREMLQRGNWVVPWFNGQMFPEKPPLMFWQMMVGYELFGVNEFAARFFSAVFGVAAALCTFHLGRVLWNARVGLWAGLITATTLIFTVSARAATVDSALTLLTTGGFLLFAMAGRQSEATGTADIRGSFRLRYAVPMYALIGAAVLAKGPVGMLLPLAAMGLFLLIADGWRNVLRSAWWMRPITAVAVIAAVAVPWYVLVGMQTDWLWPKRFFLEFNLRPFTQPIQGHGDVSGLGRLGAKLASIPLYFVQIVFLFVGFFPWSVFLGPTLSDTAARLRKKSSAGATGVSDGDLLCLCWFGVWLCFWSICKTKLPHYLLPAYPALAVLVACFVERWLAAPATLARWQLRNAWLSLILVGLGMTIAVPIAAHIFLQGEEVLGLLGLIPLIGGACCWYLASHERHNHAAATFVATAAVFLVATFGWGSMCVDPHQNASPMMAAISADGGDLATTPIATYRFFRESTVRYAGRPVVRCDGDPVADRSPQQQLQEFLAGKARAYVITKREYADEIAEHLGSPCRPIFSQRQFLSHKPTDEMIVLRFPAVAR